MAQGYFASNITNMTGVATDNLSIVNLTDYFNMSFSLDSPTADCTVFKFYLYAVSMGILCISGFIGNTVSYMVLNKDASTPVAAFLLRAIALADNSFLLLWVLNYSLREFLVYFDLDEGYMYLRVYSFPLLYVAQTQTIWLTVVIALNRFMAVCLPYRAPHLCTIYNVYKEVASVTVFSIVYNIPRFFEIQITEEIDPDTNNTRSNFERTDFGKNKLYQQVYSDAMYYLFSFVLPLLILAFVNTKVIVAYNATKRRKRRMTSRKADNENNITLVMIIVVLVFMMCQAPARIVQLVWAYKYTHCREYTYYLIHFSNTLEVLNSSNNFIVYFVFRKRFRDILIENFCVGPLASYKRKQTTRATTTEGLSLVQIEKTQVTVTIHKGGSPVGGSPTATNNYERLAQIDTVAEGDKKEQNGQQKQEKEKVNHQEQNGHGGYDNRTVQKEDCNS